MFFHAYIPAISLLQNDQPCPSFLRRGLPLMVTPHSSKKLVVQKMATDSSDCGKETGNRDYNSQSEADLALTGKLAFWTGCDTERMDKLFRRSKLFRPKWDEKRYS